MILQNPYLILMKDYLYADDGYSEYLRVNAISLKDALEKIKKSFFKHFEGEIILEEISSKTFVLVIKAHNARAYEYVCIGKVNDIKEID